ncbi:MAG: endonuclease domain-containing protein [Clostridia bacterium]|nr:endonuclease domain-containing protein [Ruminococcus sp.]MBR0088475.1 endonuclease domain-containing protein [Clostridia bacterium]
MEPKHNPELTFNARKLRKNMTKEERHLWYDFLSTYPIRFLRQRVLYNYIVDFYCAKAKLVIELDGDQHYQALGQSRDIVRDNKLQNYGITVLRFSNYDIHKNFSGICDTIDSEVQKRLKNRG